MIQLESDIKYYKLNENAFNHEPSPQIMHI